MRRALLPPHQFDLSREDISTMQILCPSALTILLAVSAVPSYLNRNLPQVSKRFEMFSIFDLKSSRNTLRTCSIAYGLATLNFANSPQKRAFYSGINHALWLHVVDSP
jgi:hypothetical protein